MITDEKTHISLKKTSLSHSLVKLDCNQVSIFWGKCNITVEFTFSILANAEKNASDEMFDPNQLGILDVFLACIAKALVVQMKVKGHVGQKGMSTFRLSDTVPR